MLNFYSARKLLLSLLFFFTFIFNANAQFVQQGPKLVGTGAEGRPYLGRSVALSADGNTANCGSSNYNGTAPGGAWIYTRSGTSWIIEQILVGTGAIGNAEQGT